MNITADNPLGSQFQFGWSERKGGKKYKTKSEVAQQKVTAMAAELQSKYFSANQESTRRVAAELRTILSSVERASQVHESDGVSFPTIHNRAFSFDDPLPRRTDPGVWAELGGGARAGPEVAGCPAEG